MALDLTPEQKATGKANFEQAAGDLARAGRMNTMATGGPPDPNKPDRRDFMKVIGGVAAMAGSACAPARVPKAEEIRTIPGISRVGVVFTVKVGNRIQVVRPRPGQRRVLDVRSASRMDAPRVSATGGRRQGVSRRRRPRRGKSR